MDDAVTRFIGQVKGILAENGATPHGLELIAEAMRELVNHPAVLDHGDEPLGNVHAGRQSAPLYTDETGLTLVRARFGPEGMTPIHNHGTWGVVGVYRGRDRYQIWRRLDDGTAPGQARVELEDELLLGPGDVIVLPEPPQDLHAQQGADGAPVDEFVLFGQNAMALPRLYFDPEAGTARLVYPSER
jgi:predicted metal-dependent enzyme (double-stranded beta helix superfamily)